MFDRVGDYFRRRGWTPRYESTDPRTDDVTPRHREPASGTDDHRLTAVVKVSKHGDSLMTTVPKAFRHTASVLKGDEVRLVMDDDHRGWHVRVLARRPGQLKLASERRAAGGEL